MDVQTLILQRMTPCGTCFKDFVRRTLMPECIPADSLLDDKDGVPRGRRSGQRRQRRQHARQPLRPGATLRRGPYGQVRPSLTVCHSCFQFPYRSDANHPLLLP